MQAQPHHRPHREPRPIEPTSAIATLREPEPPLREPRRAHSPLCRNPVQIHNTRPLCRNPVQIHNTRPLCEPSEARIHLPPSLHGARYPSQSYLCRRKLSAVNTAPPLAVA
ncbi:hypothetical protein L484_006866 [Morus notabilis]|uniref:Uncharacterized protein n=1 Tax=Morus notabilis TaxID=981085 RepID=W9QY26_9ROSA|nr:hypothetical protein L484_006866 [Morus notabilis]